MKGKALNSGWSFAFAAWQGSSSAESQKKCFTGSRRAGATPQGCYSPQLLPAASVNRWSRQQGSAYSITQPPSRPSLPKRSAGSESLLLTAGLEEIQMEKTIRLFSSSSARGRKTSPCSTPCFCLFKFFFKVKSPPLHWVSEENLWEI